MVWARLCTAYVDYFQNIDIYVSWLMTPLKAYSLVIEVVMTFPFFLIHTHAGVTGYKKRKEKERQSYDSGKAKNCLVIYA